MIGNTIGLLRKFEEVMRLAPRENDLTGLYIKFPDNSCSLYQQVLLEAADEIERLRKEVKEWRDTQVH